MHGMMSTLLTARSETKTPKPWSTVLSIIFSAYYTLMLPHFQKKVVKSGMLKVLLETFVLSVYDLEDDLNFVEEEVED